MKKIILLILLCNVCFVGTAFPKNPENTHQSIYNLVLKNANFVFESATWGEFIEWINKELNASGALQYGFVKAALPESVDSNMRIFWEANLREVSLLTILQIAKNDLFAGWKYESGVLTFYPYKAKVWTDSSLPLDSPLLAGIDFENVKINETNDAVISRMNQLGVKSAGAGPGLSSRFHWNLKNDSLLRMTLVESDWDAVHALDRLMRIGSVIEIRDEATKELRHP